MKKLFLILLATFSFLFVGCNYGNPYALDASWTLLYVQSTSKNGNIIAYAPSNSALGVTYPNAAPLEMTCQAEKGTLSLVDATNRQTYEGKYKRTERTFHAAIYVITIAAQTGTVVVSTSTYNDRTDVPTMIMTVGDYVLHFSAA